MAFFGGEPARLPLRLLVEVVLAAFDVLRRCGGSTSTAAFISIELN